jgi:hypothetical protein
VVPGDCDARAALHQLRSGELKAEGLHWLA